MRASTGGDDGSRPDAGDPPPTFSWQATLAVAVLGAVGLALLLPLVADRRSGVVVLVLGVWLAVASGALAMVVVAARRERRAAAATAARERALRQAQKMEAIGRLAGGIAHDVNNYLAAIRANCELVLRKELPPERLAAKMETVVATVVRASSLVERLLALARRQDSRPEVVQLGEVVENLLVVLRGSMPSGLTLDTDLAADLWPVRADLAQVEQTLTNLLMNAADATPVGGRIVARTRNLPASGEDPDLVELAVADTGCGIPTELQDKVFEPFFTTKEGRGATGLGLAMVYGLVAEAGGRVEIDSTVGRGSTFRVLLPRAAAAVAAAEVVPTTAEGGGGRILLVDDLGELREAAACLLRGRGYQVIEADGLATALAAASAATEPFAVVVTDVRLADGTGPDLVAELRARHAAAGPITSDATARHPIARDPIRAIFMSGYTDRIVLRGAGRGGGPGDDAYFLKKPFSAEGLERMIRQLLVAASPPSNDATR
jgi:two-component system cell cycle sensor histidine kinase/response regulator CckA